MTISDYTPLTVTLNLLTLDLAELRIVECTLVH